MINKILVAAGILYNNNNNIYIFKRASRLPIYPNYYEFAGGKLESGETHKFALKRELYEELEIEVDENDILNFNNNIVENDKYKVSFYKIFKWKNNIKLNKDIHSEYLIVNKNEIEKINNLLDTNKFISKYL